MAIKNWRIVILLLLTGCAEIKGCPKTQTISAYDTVGFLTDSHFMFDQLYKGCVYKQTEIDKYLKVVK